VLLEGSSHRRLQIDLGQAILERILKCRLVALVVRTIVLETSFKHDALYWLHVAVKRHKAHRLDFILLKQRSEAMDEVVDVLVQIGMTAHPYRQPILSPLLEYLSRVDLARKQDSVESNLQKLQEIRCRMGHRNQPAQSLLGISQFR